MSRAITNLQLAPARYRADGLPVQGTNVTFQLDGRPMSCRWPWVETDRRSAELRICHLLDLLDESRKKTDPGPLGPRLVP